MQQLKSGGGEANGPRRRRLQRVGWERWGANNARDSPARCGVEYGAVLNLFLLAVGNGWGRRRAIFSLISDGRPWGSKGQRIHSSSSRDLARDFLA